MKQDLRNKIKECLKREGVIAFSTETVCALACDARSDNAINRIYDIKKRDPKKSFSIFLKNIGEIQKYAFLDSLFDELVKKYSPGPITYVLKAKTDSVLSKIIFQNGKVGIRIPNHEIAKEILSIYNHPIVATSVNISGSNSIININDIPEKIKEQIDIIISDHKICSLQKESTVLDLSDYMHPHILREGCIHKDKIYVELLKIKRANE